MDRSSVVSRGMLCLVVPALVFAGTARAGDLTPAEIDALAARALERFQTPGIAIAVVKDGETVYAAGHGVREIGKPEAVDAHTIFGIGSVSKSFTAAAIGILVDEGKLHWDDRVIDHLPDFRMYDPWVTREITIRDLLAHRSGLSAFAGDLIWWPNAESTRAEEVMTIRHLRPESSFRTEFAYNNMLYVVAGEVVGTVSGIAWEDFVEQRILEPLGMTECRALPDRVQDNPNQAAPHVVVDGELETTFISGSGAAAAGSINCNVDGLAKYAAMLLAGGALPEGGRLLSEETHAELWKPITPMPVWERDKKYNRTHFAAYGMGWFVKDFHGYLHVWHGGGVQGLTSSLTLLPELDVAVIALTNQMNLAPVAVTSEIAHAAVAAPPEDWLEIFAANDDEWFGSAEKAFRDAFAARNADSTPTLALEAYAGTYRDRWYGDVFVELVGDRLVMRFSRSELLTGVLEHFEYDTFTVRWEDRTLHGDAYVSFSIGPAGEVESIRMKGLSPATDVSFDYQDLDLKRVVVE